MNKFSMLVVAALATAVSATSAFAHNPPPGPRQHFFKAGETAIFAGYGNINGNICNATAAVTIGPVGVNHLLPPTGHEQHADWATVVYSNTGAPCNDFRVSARFFPNGNVDNVVVHQYSTGLDICTSTGTYVGVLDYTEAGGVIVNAALNTPITVGGCVLDTDIDLVSSSYPGSPAIVD